jgi:hypothetical protein
MKTAPTSTLKNQNNLSSLNEIYARTSAIIQTPFSVGTSRNRGQTSTEVINKQRYQKNCVECTRAHRRCAFVSTNATQCSRCVKFHLTCCFKYSGTIFLFYFNLLSSPSFVTRCYAV